ncbi:MAG: hypothetical protein JXQ97_09080 [Natronospirillum sp.]
MSLTWRMFWRDFRAGELTLLIVSVVLAVTVVTSIGIFAERIRQTIFSEASSLLAADYALSGSRPIQEEWFVLAEERGLEQGQVLSFQSMLFGESSSQLGAVRAVTDNFPLRGVIEVSETPFGASTEIAAAPPPGEIWLTSRLFPLLNVAVGDYIGVGATELRVGAALIREPDSSTGVFNVQPRALMNLADLPATQAVQPGSRVTYRWLLAGDATELTELQEDIGDTIEPHYRWRSARRANENISGALDRAESFLLLAGSLAVVLAGVALAMSAQRYAGRHVETVALLKTLGYPPSRIIRLYGVGLLGLSVVGIAIGLALGEAIHRVIIVLLGDLLPDNLAQHGWQAYGLGALTGFVSLMGFAWPPFYRLRDVPPVRVIRSDVYQQPKLLWQLWGTLGVLVIVYLYSGDAMLTLAMVVGGAFCIWGASLFARGLLWVMRRFGSRFGRNWRLGLASLQRHSQQNGLQVVIFSIALMLLFTLTLIRTSLLSEWEQQLPEGAPNHFVYNVFAEDLPAVNDWLGEFAENESPAYPLTRGRLIEARGIDIDTLTENLADRSDFVRELNMTWSSEYGGDNEIVAGEWWQDYGQGELLVSVEERFATELGVQVGDRMVYSVGGLDIEATVASLRSLDWESFNPNFYMIFNQPLQDGAGATYLVSFFLSADNKVALNSLLRQVPTLSVIEVDALIEQIQGIIAQVTLAIEFILVLVLASGLLVLIAGIQSSLDTRFRESAVLRTMGASASLVRGTLWVEFGALGALAGLLGAAGTEAILFYLQGSVFGMETRWHPLLWLIAPLSGAALIGTVGVLSTSKVIRTPPMRVLRSWI